MSPATVDAVALSVHDAVFPVQSVQPSRPKHLNDPACLPVLHVAIDGWLAACRELLWDDVAWDSQARWAQSEHDLRPKLLDPTSRLSRWGCHRG